jgi:site-specific DNA-methyltransferase (adenine-specific)
MEYKLILGDCLLKLKELEDNSVDSIVTDPPYGISFMGKNWDYDVPSVEIWKECLRVLKPGGHLLSFSSPRTYHRMAINVEDAGFEIREQIMWVFGSGFPKSHNLKDEWEGWGTALKPAHEPIVMARKPLSEKTISSNVKEYGTGALNIDACRIGDEEITVNKLEEWTGFGQLKNPDYTSEKHTGRWPANFIHDGSEEVIDNFPNTGSSTPSEKNKNGGEFPEDNTIKLGLKEIRRTGFQDSGSAARYFYCAKASKQDRNEGCESLEDKCIGDKGNGLGRKCETCGASILNPCNCEVRSFINPSTKNNHPTVKPTELMKYLCRLITPKNGTVLDPFMGSGSTGKAAILEGYNFIGIELSEEYLDIARNRIKHAITKK